MLSVISLLLLGPLGTALVAAIGPVADLRIRNAFIHPDGFNRSGVLAEGILPGPLITGKKGDNFQLNVINELTDNTMFLSTSIVRVGVAYYNFSAHLFSFLSIGTVCFKRAQIGQMDREFGPSRSVVTVTDVEPFRAFVTQCPIAAGHSFLYDFNVPDQAGTFWYHSHLSSQYCDGLRGAFVVYDPEDPYAALYDVDDASTVITLEDWYRKFDAPAPVSGPAPAPDSTLINGLGRYPKQRTVSPLAVINVIQGKRYRFRLVSIACTPNYLFSINSHSFTVIEVDGENHKGVPADSVQIFVGHIVRIRD
ncbi:hypothetical protein D9757_013580 [Collybiopsis confluens]|uniref:Laccase n=1 Tax=Collybiopsis confluens TaxID=2823264 RepID=A0A8H5GKN3_9AGAR|nr:hypothetical protein D9757_013580 [Collybiopsis confluens]